MFGSSPPCATRESSFSRALEDNSFSPTVLRRAIVQIVLVEYSKTNLVKAIATGTSSILKVRGDKPLLQYNLKKKKTLGYKCLKVSCQFLCSLNAMRLYIRSVLTLQ